MYDYGGTNTMRQLEAKVASLRQPEAYPESTEEVETVETHMAWVFLTDDYAYKLKKPVKTPFFDHTDADARREVCHRELRLNRRLAADVYLDVVELLEDDGEFQVGADGEPADWLVKMRRLPDERMLDALIDRNAVEQSDLDRLVDRLVRFYEDAEAIAYPPDEYRADITGDITSKRTSMEAPHYGLKGKDIIAASRKLSDWLTDHGELLAARADRVVDAHGDLRPEHICLEDPPAIIDCLEFDRELRQLDPVSELSFLALECERLGAPGVGQYVLDGYVERTGDSPPKTLLSFYRDYHALVRAAVAIWHLDDDAVDRDPEWRKRTNWYLRRIVD